MPRIETVSRKVSRTEIVWQTLRRIRQRLCYERCAEWRSHLCPFFAFWFYWVRRNPLEARDARIKPEPPPHTTTTTTTIFILQHELTPKLTSLCWPLCELYPVSWWKQHFEDLSELNRFWQIFFITCLEYFYLSGKSAPGVDKRCQIQTSFLPSKLSNVNQILTSVVTFLSIWFFVTTGISARFFHAGWVNFLHWSVSSDQKRRRRCSGGKSVQMIVF